MARQVKFNVSKEIKMRGISGFMRRRVTAYGTGAKVTCPKEFMGKTAYLIITEEEWTGNDVVLDPIRIRQLY